jgi:hypothetical protein
MRSLANSELMNNKALAAAPIVALVTVILFVETGVGVVTPSLAKIGTNDILNAAITNPKIAPNQYRSIKVLLLIRFHLRHYYIRDL